MTEGGAKNVKVLDQVAIYDNIIGSSSVIFQGENFGGGLCFLTLDSEDVPKIKKIVMMLYPVRKTELWLRRKSPNKKHPKGCALKEMLAHRKSKK